MVPALLRVKTIKLLFWFHECVVDSIPAGNFLFFFISSVKRIKLTQILPFSHILGAAVYRRAINDKRLLIALCKVR